MFVAVALFKFSWLTVCIAVFASVSALVSCFFMPSESMIHFVRENGPVENLTLVFYVVAIAFILYSGRSFLTGQNQSGGYRFAGLYVHERSQFAQVGQYDEYPEKQVLAGKPDSMDR